MSHTFRVWALAAQRVRLHHNGEESDMRVGDGGWWELAVESAAPGDRYGFSIDGGDPLPDPRSPAQPDGVHGLSQLVDHSAFPWTDAGWHGSPLRNAVIYELHVGTFTPEGTFASAIERLDHVRDLGVTAVELMPMAQFAGSRGWGYDGVDLFAPHSAYGGPDGLKQLVDACHARGLAVVIDAVYNHVGPEGNYLGSYAPYFTDRYATPWGQAFNLDGEDSDWVREFIVDNALMWLRDYHCDGLRLDAVHAITDTSATHILEELATRVEALGDELGRDLWIIAESDANDPRLVSERRLGGYGLHAQWNDNFHHALHAALSGERNGYYLDFGSLDDVATALRQAFVYTGQYSHFRRRSFGRSIGEMPLARFVGYAQNHDQVGNRAAGDRLNALVTPGRMRIAAALTLLAPSVPLLFQGEEWGAGTPFQYFTDFGDPQVQRAVSEGRRSEFREFGWRPEDVPDPQAVATFERSKLRWDEVGEPEHDAMLRWYRALIALRRALALGDCFPSSVRSWCDNTRRALFLEVAGLLVACNLGGDALTVREAAGRPLMLVSQPVLNETAWTLVPDSVAVWGEAPATGA
ncbi:MAG: malto-oligosyltrehalose trehalohydrolase [Candidatus Dormibacteraeota bacterium]|nr:malto-oligosyltrehalose trehalohydrolase [Candidatus Dormibacteraeota bacterium]MBV9524394.1 malto-oligosyltrehalose trehalohydrolase [Candidatus Dormibacteraeota bacterium]